MEFEVIRSNRKTIAAEIRRNKLIIHTPKRKDLLQNSMLKALQAPAHERLKSEFSQRTRRLSSNVGAS